MIVFLYKEFKSAPFALKFRTEKELKTILRAFENNVNQIIEDNPFYYEKQNSILYRLLL